MSWIKTHRLWRFNPYFYFIPLVFFIAPKSWSAACCGGGFAIPSLITGEDERQWTTSISESKVDTDVFSNGVWRKRNSEDRIEVLKLDGAQIFADRYQWGLSIPVQRRQKAGPLGGESSGLADVSGHLGYEYLTDWDYSPWRPKGVGFVSLTLPTGKSIYEIEEANGLDSRGRGFFATGLGTTLTKSWIHWDVHLLAEIHRSFNKQVGNDSIQPGLGHQMAMGCGYSWNQSRFGAMVAWSYEDPIRVQGDNNSEGALQRFATGTLSWSYLFPEEWSSTISYSDQTLLGNPSNAGLSKTIALQLQKKWMR